MKAIFIANIDGFHKKFHLPHLYYLQNRGYSVDIASRGIEVFGDDIVKYNVEFGRGPFDASNLKAYFQIKKILKVRYDLIYISTPIVGIIVRLALIGRERGRVVYSAHGFNFFAGNSKLKNWIFRSIEKAFSHITDCMVTMNREDYNACLRYHFYNKELYLVNGVGIDTFKFTNVSDDEKNALRVKYNYSLTDFILIYPAELSARKNQMLLFNIVADLRSQGYNVKLLLPGQGTLLESYQKTIDDLGIADSVELLGFRTDVSALLNISDALLASCLYEGLPINVIEAMASGLPVVATAVRGHTDLVQNGVNGFLFGVADVEGAADFIVRLINDKKLYESMSLNALNSAKRYDYRLVVQEYDKVWGIQNDLTENL